MNISFDFEKFDITIANFMNDLIHLNIYIKQIYIKYFIIYILVRYVIFVVTEYFILIKENKKAYHAFIPFLNIYDFSETCRLPFIYFFIPLINILVIFLFPVKLGYVYNCNNFQKFLGVLMPDLFLIYIAFSNRMNVYLEGNDYYLKTENDVNLLENKIKDDSLKEEQNIIKSNKRGFNIKSFIENYKNKYKYRLFDKRVINKKSKNSNISKLDKLENIIINSNDTYVEDSDLIIKPTILLYDAKKIKNDNDEIVDISDDEDVIIDNVNKINGIENIISNKQIDTLSNNDNNIKKEETKSISNIAFGKNANAKSNKEDLRCPYCGSSLAGSNGTCPSCSKDVRNVVFEYYKN